VSILVSSVRCAAGRLFATLFSSDCRLCGTPLINISRLPVCQACLSGICPIAGGLCSVCGERWLTPYALVPAQDEPRCSLCRLEPRFAPTVAYGSCVEGPRQLTYLLKYEQLWSAAGARARLLSEAILGLQGSRDSFSIAVVRRRAAASKTYVASVARALKADAKSAILLPTFADGEMSAAS
jgi:predicted amidophosphoribosyltransferase